MSGRKSRTKGHAFERKMVLDFQEFFPEVCTARAESKKLDDKGVDLAFTPKFNFQCKAVENLSPCYHDILASMPDDSDYNTILHKKNRQGVVVSMMYDDFEEMQRLLAVECLACNLYIPERMKYDSETTERYSPSYHNRLQPSKKKKDYMIPILLHERLNRGTIAAFRLDDFVLMLKCLHQFGILI